MSCLVNELTITRAGSLTLLDGRPPRRNEIRRYELVSGAFFSLLAIVQLTQVVLGWSVQVATVAVPVWAAVVA